MSLREFGAKMPASECAFEMLLLSRRTPQLLSMRNHKKSFECRSPDVVQVGTLDA
jgi:hypothetical protein